MSLQRTPGNSAARLTRLRHTPWFGGVLFAAVLCTVGLYALEFAHHHETLAAELHCPICQVAAHSALEVFAPQFTPLPPAIRVHFFAFAPHQTSFLARVVPVNYRSRAPPPV